MAERALRWLCCDENLRVPTIARAGTSKAMVLRGEPGVGKSALLDALAAKGTGPQLARVVGIECETELASAGLQQLGQPLMARIDRLPRAAA